MLFSEKLRNIPAASENLAVLDRDDWLAPSVHFDFIVHDQAPRTACAVARISCSAAAMVVIAVVRLKSGCSKSTMRGYFTMCAAKASTPPIVVREESSCALRPRGRRQLRRLRHRDCLPPLLMSVFAALCASISAKIGSGNDDAAARAAPGRSTAAGA